MANIVYMARSAWTGLLDTIRSKAGITGSMTVSQAADAVNSITGGDDRFDKLVKRTITEASGSVSFIGSYAFIGCGSLTTVNFSNVTSVFPSAFQNCQKLQDVSIPYVSYIGDNAFNSCQSLQEISFPVLSRVDSSAFAQCSKLTSVSVPSLSSIGANAFASCKALSVIDLPLVSFIPQAVFANCTSLTDVSLPEASTIGTNAFQSCWALSTLSLPKVSFISASAFRYCFNLLSLYMLGSYVARLTGYPFSSTPIGGYTTSTGGVYGSIFVPASLYDQYISAAYWSTYSSRFVSVSE